MKGTCFIKTPRTCGPNERVFVRWGFRHRSFFLYMSVGAQPRTGLKRGSIPKVAEPAYFVMLLGAFLRCMSVVRFD